MAHGRAGDASKRLRGRSLSRTMIDRVGRGEPRHEGLEFLKLLGGVAVWPLTDGA